MKSQFSGKPTIFSDASCTYFFVFVCVWNQSFSHSLPFFFSFALMFICTGTVWSSWSISRFQLLMVFLTHFHRKPIDLIRVVFALNGAKANNVAMVYYSVCIKAERNAKIQDKNLNNSYSFISYYVNTSLLSLSFSLKFSFFFSLFSTL